MLSALNVAYLYTANRQPIQYGHLLQLPASGAVSILYPVAVHGYTVVNVLARLRSLISVI